MRRLQRTVLLVAFLGVLPALAGCANFDPDSLDVFGLSEKKKLPGDRRPVFPEGVPGVSQGVPPQYIKGNTPQADAALAPEQAAPPPAPAAAAAPPAEPKPKRKVAAKPKPVRVQPVAQQPQQAPQQQAPAAWPAPAPSSSGSAAWPAPPPSGTFTR